MEIIEQTNRTLLFDEINTEKLDSIHSPPSETFS